MAVTVVSLGMGIRSAGVVGLGTMGAGIAEVLAMAGLTVTVVEADPDALSRGIAILDGSLRKAVSRGRLTEDEHKEIAGRVHPAPTMAGMADADLVVEVVPEQLPVKRQVIAELDQVLRPEAIIATNTSSLSVTSIAAVAGTVGRSAEPHPDRAAELGSLFEAAGISVTSNPAHPTDLGIVAIGPEGGVLGPASAAGRAADAVGLHLPYQNLAEIVPSQLTSAGALAAAVALATRLGLTAVRSADRPGLLAGALLFAHLRDAVAMVADGYATPADVDTAMTLGCGYPRGPMRLLAEAGAGKAADVLSAMHAGYGDPAFAPPPLLREYAIGGLPVQVSGAS